MEDFILKLQYRCIVAARMYFENTLHFSLNKFFGLESSPGDYFIL